VRVKKIDDKRIAEIHRKLWDDAIAEHGDVLRVPRDTVDFISEIERSLYVLNLWDGSGHPSRILGNYMVRDFAVEWVFANVLNGFEVVKAADDPTREKRKDKYAKLERLAAEKIYHEFTTDELVEHSGLSSASVVKWAKTTGYFRSIGRGKWEARNPKDDRENVKASK